MAIVVLSSEAQEIIRLVIGHSLCTMAKFKEK